jgi:antagonist of KipI
MSALIRQSGFLTTVQDAGRAGWRALGISPGGACDPFAVRLLNLLTGNAEAAALLEIALGGLRLEVEEPRLVAWSGGGFIVRIEGAFLPPGCPALLRPGEQIAFSYAHSGCRAWLSITGGVETPRILGSRATDLQARFGGLDGRALRGGDRLPLGEPSARAQRLMEAMETQPIASWTAPGNWTRTALAEPSLRVVRGAEWEHFRSEAHAAFLGEPFTVTPDANRMGARLAGPPLPLAREGELLSSGVTCGTLQAPANGPPILLLADAQTIGGYPKLAHVITVDLPVAAQLRPGDLVRFQEVTLREAHELLRERERHLARFRIGLSLRMP